MPIYTNINNTAPALFGYYLLGQVPSHLIISLGPQGTYNTRGNRVRTHTHARTHGVVLLWHWQITFKYSTTKFAWLSTESSCVLEPPCLRLCFHTAFVKADWQAGDFYIQCSTKNSCFVMFRYTLLFMEGRCLFDSLCSLSEMWFNRILYSSGLTHCPEGNNNYIYKFVWFLGCSQLPPACFCTNARWAHLVYDHLIKPQYN